MDEQDEDYRGLKADRSALVAENERLRAALQEAHYGVNDYLQEHGQYENRLGDILNGINEALESVTRDIDTMQSERDDRLLGVERLAELPARDGSH